jgi:hypothetical protein
MQINDALNLVVPLRRDDNGEPTIYAYHTPVSKEVLDANYWVLAQTKAAIFAKGATFAADVGPCIAALKLRDEGKKYAAENGMDGDSGVGALLSDLHRLTMVLAPGANGWENMPVDIAVQRGLIDQEDWSEAESGLAFFTASWSMAKKADRKRMAEGLAGVLGASITSSTLMDFAASLSGSTPNAATAHPKAVSSHPS